MERMGTLHKRLEAVEASLRGPAYASGQVSANIQQTLEALFSRLAASEAATRSLVNPKTVQPYAAAAARTPVSAPAPAPVTKAIPAEDPKSVQPYAAAAARTPASAPAPAPVTKAIPAEDPPPAVASSAAAEITAPPPPSPPPPAAAAVPAVAAAAEASSTGRAKEGFLSEKGKNFFKPWQKRYFVVDDTSLTAYMSDRKDVQMSRIELKDVKMVEAKDKEITLHMAVGKKTLKGATLQEAVEWAQALKH